LIVSEPRACVVEIAGRWVALMVQKRLERLGMREVSSGQESLKKGIS
jgi:hypothetical protein